MDETSDEDDAPPPGPTHSTGASSTPMGLAGVSSVLGASALSGEAARQPGDDNQDMSVSTLHLYDLHLTQVWTDIAREFTVPATLGGNVYK